MPTCVHGGCFGNAELEERESEKEPKRGEKKSDGWREREEQSE